MWRKWLPLSLSLLPFFYSRKQFKWNEKSGDGRRVCVNKSLTRERQPNVGQLLVRSRHRVTWGRGHTRANCLSFLGENERNSSSTTSSRRHTHRAETGEGETLMHLRNDCTFVGAQQPPRHPIVTWAASWNLLFGVRLLLLLSLYNTPSYKNKQARPDILFNEGKAVNRTFY